MIKVKNKMLLDCIQKNEIRETVWTKRNFYVYKNKYQNKCKTKMYLSVKGVNLWNSFAKELKMRKTFNGFIKDLIIKWCQCVSMKFCPGLSYICIEYIRKTVQNNSCKKSRCNKLMIKPILFRSAQLALFCQCFKGNDLLLLFFSCVHLRYLSWKMTKIYCLN